MIRAFRHLLAPALCSCLPALALAAAELEETSSSPDITISVDSQAVADEDAVLRGSAPTAVEDLGPLARPTDLQALDLEDGGGALFVLDITSTLGAAGTVGPRDVVRYDGANYSLEFDGAANGLPPGSRIDALSQTSEGDLLLSLDVTVFIDAPHAAVAFTAADEDVLRWSAADGFSLELDASAAGVPQALDTDSLHLIEASQNLLLSFDTSGQVGGVNFDDEDVLEYDPDDGSFELSVDATAGAADWAAADLDAFHAVRSCGALGGDSDGDKLCQDEDPCPSFANTLPANIGMILNEPNGDANLDGIPNECQCGDVNRDGVLANGDLVVAFQCVANDPFAQSPPCSEQIFKGDTDNSGTWNNGDLVRIFTVFSGPNPSYGLTCSARPEGVEPPPLP